MPGSKRYVDAGTFLSASLRGSHVTNASLASHAGVQLSTVRSWISGWSRPPMVNAEAYEAIEALLGIDVANRYRDLASATGHVSDSALLRLTGFITRGSLNEAVCDIPHVSEHPEAVELNRSLGSQLFACGRFDEARDCYERAIALSRVFGTKLITAESLANELASRYAEAHLFDEASGILKEFIAVEHYAPHIWHRLGIVAWYHGDLVESLAYLAEAEAQDYDAGLVAHARGQVLAELGHLEPADRNLRCAMSASLSPRGRAYVLAALAFVRFMSGVEDEGFELFDEAKTETPDNGWLYYRLGLCFHSIGNQTQATRAFTNALSCETPKLVPRMLVDIENKLRTI